MMKSFFKKLAFVMALAMVVSMVAPAGAVFAAEEGISLGGVVYEEYALDVEESKDFAFAGYEGWKKGTPCTWESSDETVAIVDNGGIVTGLKDGVATITVTVNNTWVQSMVVTVGAGAAEEDEPVVSGAFEAKQTTDTYAEVTFENTEITAEEVAGALEIYWYVTEDYRVTQPYQLISVEDGVALINVYGFNDGIVYEFVYGEYTDTFTAHIGEVASIDIKVYATADKSVEGYAYANKDAYIVYTLKNAQGIDITNVALNSNTGAYVEYSLVSESNVGEFWLNDTTGTTDSPEGKIYFTTAGARAQVKAKFITGKYNETTGAPIAGPETTVLPVISTNAPSYRFTATLGASVMSQTTTGSSFNWNNSDIKIALGDEIGAAKKVVFKMKDSDKQTVYSDAYNAQGTWSFASTNNGIAFVDPTTGEITTNSEGVVSVLVYFRHTPTAANQNPQKFLVGVTTLDVRPARAVTKINVPSTNMNNVVSSKPGDNNFNKKSFYVEILDQLEAKINPNNPLEVKRNNSTLPAGVTEPTVTATQVGKGKYRIDITGAANCLPAGSTSYPFTYVITADNAPAKQFTVTVRKPIYSDLQEQNLVVSGYEVVISGDSDLKTSYDDDALEKEFTVTLNVQSNAVNVKVQNVQQKLSNTIFYADNFYYTVTKDGKDITDKTTVANTGTAIKVSLTDIATSAAVGGDYVVDNTKLGTGSYVVTVYKAVGATSGTTTQALSIVQTKQKVVTNSQKTISYAYVKTAATYKAALFAAGSTTAQQVEQIVLNCFKFNHTNGTQFGGSATSCTLPSGVRMVVAANVPGGSVTIGDVIYVKYIDFYVDNGDMDSKNVYTVNRVYINDYVTVEQ